MNLNCLQISFWNANGLLQHRLEVINFLASKNIDALLISETHLTNRHIFSIPGFRFFRTNHPDNKAHGGTGILINSRLDCYQKEDYATNFLQATSVCLQHDGKQTTLSAVYCPPRYKISEQQFRAFFATLGNRFIAAGDFNAKHTHWGSRLINTRGKQLLFSIISGKLDFASPAKPTYWPTDLNKTPDLIDFAITKGINKQKLSCTTSSFLSSDHCPVLLQVLNDYQAQNPVALCQSIDWIKYKKYISSHIKLNNRLHSAIDIERFIKRVNCLLYSAIKAATCKVPLTYTQAGAHYSSAALNEHLKLHTTRATTNSTCEVTTTNQNAAEHTTRATTISTCEVTMTNKNAAMHTTRATTNSTCEVTTNNKNAAVHTTRAPLHNSCNVNTFWDGSQQSNASLNAMASEKRRLRREWQKNRSPASKSKLHEFTKKFKNALRKEEECRKESLLSNLSAQHKTKLSLWKMCKTLTTPTELEPPLRNQLGNWARSDDEKALTFAQHLASVFQPHPGSSWLPEFQRRPNTDIEIRFSFRETKQAIQELDPSKAPGFDKITPKMIIEMPNIAISEIVRLFNSTLKIGYFPLLWKKSLIKMIPKPGKNISLPSSYRPISLLP